MEGYFTVKILLTTETNFFSRATVLLGDSSIKKLTELYDLKKYVVMLWTLLVPIIN